MSSSQSLRRNPTKTPRPLKPPAASVCGGWRREEDADELEAALNEWRDYFGCDCPQDAGVNDGSALGKANERANRAEAKVAKLREALKPLADEYLDSWSGPVDLDDEHYDAAASPARISVGVLRRAAKAYEDTAAIVEPTETSDKT